MQVIPNETHCHILLTKAQQSFWIFVYTMTVYCTSLSEKESSKFYILNLELKCTQPATLFNSKYRGLKVIW